MSEFLMRESALLGDRYYVAHHASGLPVIVFPKKMSTTYAMMAVRFGAIDNLPDASGATPFPDGVAHFLEHKLFANEDGSDSFERFAALGADANAYTAHSRTVYLFSCTDRFEDSLAELLRFVTHPWFTPESVQKEQGIIAEEIRMCRDDPYDRCYQNMLSGLYAHHPVRVDICGSEQSIARITEQTLYDAYNTYYTSRNMALIVCGDVTPDAVMAVANAELSTLADRTAPTYKGASEQPTAARPLTVAYGQVAKPIFIIGVKDAQIPQQTRARTRRNAAMDILCEMLFSETGELYNKLHDARLISPEISFGYVQTRDVGFLRFSGESDVPEKVLEEIQSYLSCLRETGLSREDFEHYRRIEFAEYIKGFDSTEEIAENILAFLFDDDELFAYADVIRGVEFEEVAAIFEEFFDPARITLSVVRPNTSKGE
ncbi:MAG: insulinase family protein [Ruminococcaceae bacterium]|nr:insulinase family protein [Oscillospiraceae bacterium]